jgi:2-amino-4-hydroxy-6-hydroxymethyldihydropteridine diphosphokinase
MRVKTAFLGLGSNLDDRAAYLARAIERLAAAAIQVVRESSIYETAPMLYEDQPWFLNQVIEVKTALFPRQLLHSTQEIERELGRRRTIAKGPRTIDIDILLYGRTVMSSDELTIPHPGMAERRFVLEPLNELAPRLRHPVLKRTIGELLGQVKDQETRPFGLPGRGGL